MNGQYILEGKIPVKCDDLMQWAKSMEKPESRRVAQDEIDGVRVSTVFLGLDHSFGGNEPLLFETMVFGGPLDGEMDRCATWEQAELMHQAMVAAVRSVMAGH